MLRNAHAHPPKLTQFDALGQRIDQLHTSEGWRFFKAEAARDQLIAQPYTDLANPNRRLEQLVKLFLFSPGSGMVSCPLAMTDGAAFVLSQMK